MRWDEAVSDSYTNNRFNKLVKGIKKENYMTRFYIGFMILLKSIQKVKVASEKIRKWLIKIAIIHSEGIQRGLMVRVGCRGHKFSLIRQKQ